MKSTHPISSRDSAQHQGDIVVAGVSVAQLERELEETMQNDCDRDPADVSEDALAVIRTLLAPVSDTGIPVSPGHDQHQLARQRDAADVAARASALRQLGTSTAPGSAGSPLRGSSANPVTYPGELYAGICQDPDVGPLHLILLPGDVRVDSIEEAEEFAASVGGQLPSHAELQHLHEHMAYLFKPSFYYSRDQELYEGDMATVMFDFAGRTELTALDWGAQQVRVRAVRHVHADIVPGHLATSPQFVDTLSNQQRGGVVHENDPSYHAYVESCRARGVLPCSRELFDADQPTETGRDNDRR